MIALGLGIILGLISSTPLGPINLNVARWAHIGHKSRLIWFVAGVLFADLLVASLALLGMIQAQLTDQVLKFIGLGGGILFFVYGITIFLRQQQSELPKLNEFPAKVRSDLLTGFFFCAANPSFYLFWLYGSTLVAGLEGPITMATTLHFLGGVFLGDLIWFTVFAKIVSAFRERLSLNFWLRASSALICLFGLFTIWRSLNGSLSLH